MYEGRGGGNHGSGRGRVVKLVLLCGIAIVVIPTPAAAYIDPVSGSVLLQIISAAVLAGAVTFSRARNWLLGLFRRGGKGDARDVE
jgi:hypothetical protein